MAKRRKVTRTAGNLVSAVLYTPVTVNDKDQRRAAKQRLTTAARARINLRTSTQKLREKLAVNFRAGDLWVTLTFGNDYATVGRAEALVLFRRFVKRLRRARAGRGKSIHYIYVYESAHGDKRPHIHMVVNSSKGKRDMKEIREAWAYGDDIEVSSISDAFSGFTALALYMTKEPREKGKPKKGERMWVASQGLREAKKESEPVSEGFAMRPPVNAWIIHNEIVENEWGGYQYIEYVMPDEQRKKIPWGYEDWSELRAGRD